MAAVSAKQALRMLAEGNTRFATQSSSHPNQTAARIRTTGLSGQQPFSAVLACADSRCPVEQVFDAGIGDIFTVRLAGNFPSAEAIGSLEYAVSNLAIPLIVVLGHTYCGALNAVISGEKAYGSMSRMLTGPSMAVSRAKKSSPRVSGDELLAHSVIENVWLGIEELLKSGRIVSGAVANQKLAVVGAVYDVTSGKVDWLGEHPFQQRLMH